MITVFDLACSQPYEGIKFHGGGEYTKTVFSAFVESCTEGFQSLYVCYDYDRFLDDWLKDIIEANSIKSINVKSKAEIVSFVNELANTDDVIYYAGIAYGYEGLKFSGNVKTIGTFHGLRLIEKPIDKNIIQYMTSMDDLKTLIGNIFFQKRLQRRIKSSYEVSMKLFDYIITVSEHSKYSIKVNFPEINKSKKIIRLYPPIKHIDAVNQMLDDNSQRKYILMISGNRWLKNSSRGVMAIDKLYSRGYLDNIKTRVYGNLPEKIRKALKNIDKFEFYNYATTEELENAYKNCQVFFYPTLNEGFGSPPLEAMKYGRTCVISSVCSLPEVYGDSVYYCNPYDLLEMQNRILQAVEKPMKYERVKSRVEQIFSLQNEDLEYLIDLIKGKVS